MSGNGLPNGAAVASNEHIMRGSTMQVAIAFW